MEIIHARGGTLLMALRLDRLLRPLAAAQGIDLPAVVLFDDRRSLRRHVSQHVALCARRAGGALHRDAGGQRAANGTAARPGPNFLRESPAAELARRRDGGVGCRRRLDFSVQIRDRATSQDVEQRHGMAPRRRPHRAYRPHRGACPGLRDGGQVLHLRGHDLQPLALPARAPASRRPQPVALARVPRFVARASQAEHGGPQVTRGAACDPAERGQA